MKTKKQPTKSVKRPQPQSLPIARNKWFVYITEVDGKYKITYKKPKFKKTKLLGIVEHAVEAESLKILLLIYLEQNLYVNPTTTRDYFKVAKNG